MKGVRDRDAKPLLHGFAECLPTRVCDIKPSLLLRNESGCGGGLRTAAFVVSSEIFVLVQNTLFYGDNLKAPRRHVRYEPVYLCYINPPFNSKRNYNQIYNNIGSEDRAQAQ